MKTITKKRKLVLDLMNNYKSEYGVYPTYEEIKKKLKLKAVSTIHEHVTSLKKGGYLSDEDQVFENIIRIPVLGKIAAGQPIEAIEVIDEHISIVNSNIKSPNDYYALKVEGNSMIDDGIYNGDIVVIKKQSVAENGQTVVAIIDDNQATLKKIFKEKGRFKLQPRNPNMLPLFRDEVEVRGVVVQIINNMQGKVEVKKKGKVKHGFSTLDLFAGIGGIRIGFENAGFKTVFANDFEEKCRDTYDLNFNNAKLVVEDLRKIGVDDLPKFDFLLGGFPCQAFSIAGYRQGFKDEKDRGNLFFDIARILEARKPEGFLLENVKNLKSHDNGRTFEVIAKTLKELGYHIKFNVLNSMDYGNVPQNRERIYIVGFKNSNYIEKFKFPEKVKLTKRILDVLEENVPEKYYYNDKPLFKKLKKFINQTGKVYQWRRQYVRENKSGVCPTLTANMGMGGHNVPLVKDKKGIRKLTPRECARIQGFPDTFKLPEISDSALYKQLGNSVSVPVLEAIAKQMMKAMTD